MTIQAHVEKDSLLHSPHLHKLSWCLTHWFNLSSFTFCFVVYFQCIIFFFPVGTFCPIPVILHPFFSSPIIHPLCDFLKFNSLRILYSCQCSRLSSDLHMLFYFSALYHRLSQTSHEHFVLLPKVFWSRNLRFPRRWLTGALNPDM